MIRAEAVPGDGLLHAVPLGALAVMVLNDHWWKRAYPSFVTGKLSDVAGLVFFPLLLQAMWELGRAWAGVGWGPSRRVLVAAGVATAVVFALAKTWGPVNEGVRAVDAALRWPVRVGWALARGEAVPGVGRSGLVRDPTDLVALPAVLVGLRRGPARRREERRRSAASPRT